jgi:hypothetical protein
VKVSKKNGWWFFGGQLRCSMKIHEGYPWKTCMWQGDLIPTVGYSKYSGYSLGGNPRILGNQPILWQGGENGSWAAEWTTRKYQELPS